ncbi:hypothetical protein EDB86DRAFT_603409 [Lactarius hatsudake]|nr:hypothetical protein EDB86DRAFT_603409 [Lactarius hatsudake]
MLYPLSSSTLSLPLTQIPKTQIQLQGSGGLVIAFATASSHHLHTSRHVSAVSAQLASPAAPTPQPAAHAYVRRPSHCRRLTALGPTQMSFTFHFLFISYLFRPGRTSRSCERNDFAAASTPPHPHPHVLPLDPDRATSTMPRYPHRPGYDHYLDTASTATSTPLRDFHQRRAP